MACEWTTTITDFPPMVCLTCYQSIKQLRTDLYTIVDKKDVPNTSVVLNVIKFSFSYMVLFPYTHNHKRVKNAILRD